MRKDNENLPRDGIKQHIAPETASRTLLSIVPNIVSEDILKPLS
jgi:hypothetical protein